MVEGWIEGRSLPLSLDCLVYPPSPLLSLAVKTDMRESERPRAEFYGVVSCWICLESVLTVSTVLAPGTVMNDSQLQKRRWHDPYLS